jgi:Holliday junction resolvase RusA-like endonuclease
MFRNPNLNINAFGPQNRKKLQAAVESVGTSPLEKCTQGIKRPTEKCDQTASPSSAKTFVIISLPHPHKDLKPNGGTAHRFAKARAAKAAKKATAWACMNQYPRFAPGWKDVTVEIHAYYTTNRGRDADNLISSCKAILDGICQAGIIANDKGVVWLPVVWLIDKHAPRLEFMIRKT